MKEIALKEWEALLKSQGVPLVDVTFECPRCKTLQSANDLIKAGAGKTLDEVQPFLGYSCVGRWTKDKGCDWTLGGLFQIHELVVVTEDGVKHPRFRPLTAAQQAEEKAAAPPVKATEVPVEEPDPRKRTTAETTLEVTVECPYCEECFDCLEDVREELGNDLQAKGIDVEVTCPECKQEFVITEVTF